MSAIYYPLRRLGHFVGQRLLPAPAGPQESGWKLAALLFVAYFGGLLPICNLAMISSAYLALSGDFNTDLVNLTTMILGNLMMMCVALPLTSYVQRALGLRLSLFFTLGLLAVSGTGTALAGTMPGVCFGYALMGLGGCLYLGLASRIIMATAPQQFKRRLILSWTFFIGFSSSLGPFLGGVLVEHMSWRSLFFLSPIVAVPGMIIVLFLVPDLRLPRLPKMDRVAFTLLLTLAVTALFAVCYGQTLGWNSTPIQVLIFISVSALFLFVVSCFTSPNPLLHIRNFGIRGVSPALLMAVLFVTTHVGIRIEVILYGRYILGYTPTQIATLFLLPLGFYVVTVLSSAVLASSTGRIKPFVVTGLSLLLVASLLLSRMDANVWRLSIVFALCLDYMGYAMADTCITPLIMRNIPHEKQAHTLAAVSCFRFFALTLTIGILTPMNVQLKQYYLTRLAAQVNEFSTAATSTIGHWEHIFMSQGLGAAKARHSALSMVEESIKGKAAVFTFDHLFLYFALLAAIGIVLTLISRKYPFERYYRYTAASIRRRLGSLRRSIRGKNAQPVPDKPWHEPDTLRRASSFLVPLLAVILTIGMAGCTMGPDYERPPTDLPAQSEDAPGDLFTSDNWWKVFNDPVLNDLVEQALGRNLDLAQAMARVEVARAEVGEAFASRLPSAELTGGAGKRQMTEGEQLVHHYESRTQESYYAMPTLSFELDLWGKYKRIDEAARASLLATEAARDTVRLSLTTETARAYFMLRTLQEQKRLAADMLESYDRTCKVYDVRYRLGQTPEITLRRFEAERAKTKAMLLRLEKEQIHTEGALAVLAGYTPREIAGSTPEALAKGLALLELVLPPDIPSGLPSDLLRRRPDVRVSEGKLMAANALIGAQMAAFFPSFSLTGNLGYSTTEFDEFFMGTSGVWNLAGRINLPLFEGGRLKSGLRKREAMYEEAKAAYFKSVQDAFKETRDALADNRISRDEFEASLEQVRTLTRSNDIMGRQYDAGLSSVMDLLDVRRQLLAAQQNCAEARRRELESVVLLCKAMGGGWTEESGFDAVAGQAESQAAEQTAGQAEGRAEGQAEAETAKAQSRP